MHSSSSIPNGASAPSAQDSSVKYTQRLLPQLVDTFAAEDPTHVLGMAAKSEDLSQGFTSITTSELCHAVNFTAHWLDSQRCLTPGSSETIAFIGSQDFRYWVLELASMKAGHPVLLPSPRNALPNTVSLLEITNCKALFYSGPLEEQAVALSEQVNNLTIIKFPTLEEMATGKTEHYPYPKTWEEAKNDVVMIVHTSGSTGAPKPIYYTNKFIGRAMGQRELVPSVPGRTLANLSLLKRKKPFFIGTPFFHLSGVLFGFSTISCQTTAVMGPPDVPLSGKIVRDIARAVKLNGMIMVPSLLDATISEEADDLLPSLNELEHVCWLGGRFTLSSLGRLHQLVTNYSGPLGTSTGEWITKYTKANLWQIFGSTEVGMNHMLVAPRSHWQYMEFHPIIGPTLERLSPDSDFYEVVLHRQPANEWSRPVFDIFPDKTEWRSRDILSRCKDPGCENLWKYEGRLDDMMLLSNGLKVNPVHLENRLQTHPALKGCLVVGYGYTRCGLLIEPKDASVEKKSVVELVWPAVEEANSFVPEHARIERELVIVAHPEKPFPRASKGTIIRALTIRAYEQEIKEVYCRAG
jgi:acyl-coenzyme A synthetase/AMP-(fatty) acid ligase